MERDRRKSSPLVDAANSRQLILVRADPSGWQTVSVKVWAEKEGSEQKMRQSTRESLNALQIAKPDARGGQNFESSQPEVSDPDSIPPMQRFISDRDPSPPIQEAVVLRQGPGTARTLGPPRHAQGTDWDSHASIARTAAFGNGLGQSAGCARIDNGVGQHFRDNHVDAHWQDSLLLQCLITPHQCSTARHSSTHLG